MPQCFLRGHWHTVDSGDVIGFGTAIGLNRGPRPRSTQLAQTGLHLRTMDKAAIGDQRQLQRRLRRLLPQYLSDASHRIRQIPAHWSVRRCRKSAMSISRRASGGTARCMKSPYRTSSGPRQLTAQQLQIAAAGRHGSGFRPGNRRRPVAGVVGIEVDAYQAPARPAGDSRAIVAHQAGCRGGDRR